MIERWPKALNTILTASLAVLLVLTLFVYVYQNMEVRTLRSSLEQRLQTLQNQTHMIIELRQQLSRESFQNFESTQELQAWINNWVITRMPIVIEYFGVSIALRGEKYSIYQDCDDFAEAMQRDALKDGYLISVILIDSSGTIFGIKVTNLANHAGILAVAENTYWYVEPQLGTMVKIARRD